MAPALNPGARRYTYFVRGAAQKVRFMIADTYYGDNYGGLRARVRLATVADCAAGQFANLGYSSQGDCELNITR
jgi:hypothetical protein